MQALDFPLSAKSSSEPVPDQDSESRIELRRNPTLLLKSTPPRCARDFLDRSRLSALSFGGSSAQVTALLAPVGFGKSSQLAHWRRQSLARGEVAIWYTVDDRDEPKQLMRGLAHSARLASGKRAFSDPFLAWLEGQSDPIDAATGWLAEIAELAVEAHLFLDDVDLLPTSSRTRTLPYLLGNTPSNLHIVLAARPTGALTAIGALSMTTVARVSASDLRFRQDETLAVLANTIGTRIGLEASVRLHEITEGWPLGVQLAAAALRRTGDVTELLAAATDDIRRYFIDFAIDRQTDEARHLLVRLAQLDTIHPDLCAAILGGAPAARQLLLLQDETPLVLSTEDRDWMRLHPLARDALRGRLALLPFAERQALSRAASAWYAAHDLNEEAAQQSFLAGDVENAISLVERSTYRMTLQGRSSAVLDWYRRLPRIGLDEHSGFWAPVAWALAMSDQNVQAQPLIDRIMGQPNLAASLRFEADLIAGTAAGFADDMDSLQTIHNQWPAPPGDARPSDLVVWANGQAFLALFRGLPNQARLQWSRISSVEHVDGYSPVSYGFADYGTGLTYLWEGKYTLATNILRPALLRAEQRMGVRNPVTCMLAALLAEASCEGNADAESLALLAGRMETLEHHGLPDAIIAAYRTAARVADSQGRQDHALDLLESLRVIGQTRAMLRLQAAALYEIVCLHARHGRAETAWSLNRQLEALVVDQRAQISGVFVPWAELYAHLALARAALAQLDDTRLAPALHAAECAAILAANFKREAEAITARFLRAEILRRQGSSDAVRIRDEAISLAELNGQVRTLREHGAASNGPALDTSAATHSLRTIPRTDSPTRSTRLLTVKEQEILVLLSRALSNKEIANAMSISEETVKWHVKNLFAKLSGASRKHTVARAKLLGLLP